MNDYEDKQQRKAERYRELAEKNAKESESRANSNNIKTEKTMRNFRIQINAIDSIYSGKDDQEALENYAKDAGYSSYQNLIDRFGGVETVAELPEAFREEAIDYIMDHQDIVENGTIHLWVNKDQGCELSHTIGSQEYRDEDHIRIVSFKIQNESKPYDRDVFEFQFDNQ